MLNKIKFKKLAPLILFVFSGFSNQFNIKAQLPQIDFSKIQSGQVEFVPGEVLVKYKDTVSAQSASVMAMSLGQTVKKQVNLNGKGPFQLVNVPNGSDIVTAIKTLQNDPNVEYAQPNYIYHATTNDTNYSEQWSLKNTGQLVAAGLSIQYAGTPGKDINIEAVWATWPTLKNCSSVTIAVLDSGVDLTHTDLSANIATGSYSCPGGTGANGCDFVGAGSNNPTDGFGHGTHVSGIIGAVGSNAAGVTGVCQTAKILPVRVLDNTGAGTTTDIIEGLNFAVGTSAGQGNAKIVNLSLGGSGFDPAFFAAVESAQSLGVLVVVAAGNGGADGIGDDHTVSPIYPCDFPSANIICVAAVNQNYYRASFSDYDSNPDPSLRTVDLGAPGVNMLSTYLSNQYAYAAGTSSAAPMVTGVAAMLFVFNPAFTYEDVADSIIYGGDAEASMDGITKSGTVLDAFKSITTLPAPRNVTLKVL